MEFSESQKGPWCNEGIRERNLYYLKGSTVTCSLTVSVVRGENATQLCHMRLGHAGEKFMQALAK